MATVNFAVGVPTGELQGTVDGRTNIDIGSYLALFPTGATLPNNIIYCIAPDTPIASGLSTYNVLQGIDAGFSTTQVNAIEGLYSHYFQIGNTSFGAQEVLMLAEWKIIQPTLTVSGVSTGVVAQADALAHQALDGSLAINSNLDFLTLENTHGHQSFIDVVDPTPIPPSLGLFIAALAILAGFAAKKKFARRVIRVRS